VATGGGGGGGGSSTTTKTGLVNLNTASENVMMALGLTQSQADGIITARTDAALTDLASVQQAISGGAPSGFYQETTLSSYQYSADIVAVSGDGRAFKRVRIVVSCAPASGSSTATTPSQIIYRRDLTSFGWPLDPQIQKSLRAGEGIQIGTPGTNLTTMGAGAP
jgi:hypothetical protein